MIIVGIIEYCFNAVIYSLIPSYLHYKIPILLHLCIICIVIMTVNLFAHNWQHKRDGEYLVLCEFVFNSENYLPGKCAMTDCYNFFYVRMCRHAVYV